MDAKDLDKWFDEKGNKTVLFCRFIPVVRSLISIPAGMSEMKLPKFLVLTTIGSLIWNTVLVIIGASLGENWEKLVLVMDEYSTIALIELSRLNSSTNLSLSRLLTFFFNCSSFSGL